MSISTLVLCGRLAGEDLLNNSWNRLIYGCWAPIYDWFIGIPPFVRARRMAIDRLGLQPGDRLLIVGIGTGADLPFLPPRVDAVGIDLSLSMLRIASQQAGRTPGNVQLIVADAAQLPFRPEEFDRVLLGLILSVVPDPQACLAEVTRVTSPDCRIVVFDKFLHRETPSLLRRLANVVTRFFGTDINRDLAGIVSASKLATSTREPAAFGGAYEVIELRHESCSLG